MIYLKRSNNEGKKNREILIVIIFILAILFGLYFFFPRFYPSIFYPVTSVAWKTETAVVDWFSFIGNMLKSKSSLLSENEAFKRELDTNKTSLLTLTALQQENENLKSILGRKPEGQMVLGVVMSRPPISPYDTLVIDSGSNDGIEVGDRVYTEGDVLIGEVAEIYSNESKVTLFSTPGKKTNISFVNSSVEVEAIGRGGGNFMANIPIDAGIKEGDMVILPDIKLHTFGIVKKIAADRANSFSTILFKTPININAVRFVEVQIKK